MEGIPARSLWDTIKDIMHHQAEGDSELVHPFGEIACVPPNSRPTMRRVSRTHRVDLDRLYDCINLDPEIPIKYVNTTQQLTDILEEGSFQETGGHN